MYNAIFCFPPEYITKVQFAKDYQLLGTPYSYWSFALNPTEECPRSLIPLTSSLPKSWIGPCSLLSIVKTTAWPFPEQRGRVVWNLRQFTVADEDDDEKPVWDRDDDGAVGSNGVKNPLNSQTVADRPWKLYTIQTQFSRTKNAI